VPSDEGYEYLAGRLASNGYIVVSISANKLNFADRHIAGDEGMLLARGRLVLRHLALLSDWNRNGTPANIQKTIGADLKGKLDFSNIAMMGHSRGGEGVRAARKLYPDAPWKKLIGDAIFKGIFEIAPTDGCRTFPFICKAGVDDRFKDGIIADGVPWNVLLPMCDGDLVELEGVRAFDRVLNSSTEDPASQKSSYTVWGANHNFYNTEWQISDATSLTAPFKAICIPDTVHIPLFPVSPGSPEQRLTALSSVLAFFRANVGKVDASFNQNFDPLYALPCKVTGDVDNKPANYPARVSRGYTPSPGKGGEASGLQLCGAHRRHHAHHGPVEGAVSQPGDCVCRPEAVRITAPGRVAGAVGRQRIAAPCPETLSGTRSTTAVASRSPSGSDSGMPQA
jgi:hypothetical protein